MRVMAQMAMVMNLDRVHRCQPCSVTCKQAWTNRSGTEYVWFNNVETRPGSATCGLPGSGPLAGRLDPGSQGPVEFTTTAAGPSWPGLSNPLPSIDDYYEPWTYDYENLTSAPLGEQMPVAPPRSPISGKPMKVSGRPNWDDDLRRPRRSSLQDPVLGEGRRAGAAGTRRETFMFYPPRICEHCLNPACVASPVRCDVQSAARTASSSSIRTAAGAGGCAFPDVPCQRRSISTTRRARPRSARCVTRASRSGCRRCVRDPLRAVAVPVWCSMTWTGCWKRPRCPTSTTCRGAASDPCWTPTPGGDRGRACGGHLG